MDWSSKEALTHMLPTPCLAAILKTFGESKAFWEME